MPTLNNGFMCINLFIGVILTVYSGWLFNEGDKTHNTKISVLSFVSFLFGLYFLIAAIGSG